MPPLTNATDRDRHPAFLELLSPKGGSRRDPTISTVFWERRQWTDKCGLAKHPEVARIAAHERAHRNAIRFVGIACDRVTTVKNDQDSDSETRTLIAIGLLRLRLAESGGVSRMEWIRQVTCGYPQGSFEGSFWAGMSDVTRILSAIEQGDPQASEQLLPLVYEELRRLAAQKLAVETPGQTLQATALVHEAYIRLVDTDKVRHFNSRGHFFVAAAEAMRRILINRARDGKRLKRGRVHRRIDLDGIEIALNTSTDELLALDEAMLKLATEYPECAELVKLRFFAGLSLCEASTTLGIPRRTADRSWAFARAWLHRQLSRDAAPADS
jgi:RNA polymerase sigma factor (TIGR02999 family)